MATLREMTVLGMPCLLLTRRFVLLCHLEVLTSQGHSRKRISMLSTFGGRHRFGGDDMDADDIRRSLALLPLNPT